MIQLPQEGLACDATSRHRRDWRRAGRGGGTAGALRPSPVVRLGARASRAGGDASAGTACGPVSRGLADGRRGPADGGPVDHRGHSDPGHGAPAPRAVPVARAGRHPRLRCARTRIPIILLFLGGFIIALAMQKWGLHRRVAITLIGALGTRPRRIILGFLALVLLHQHVGQQHGDRDDDAADCHVRRGASCRQEHGRTARLAGIRHRPDAVGRLRRNDWRNGHADRHAAECPAGGLHGQRVPRRNRLRSVDAARRAGHARHAADRVRRAHARLLPARDERNCQA